MSTDPMLDPGGGEPEVWLRPIERADYDPLCRYELSLTLGPRWRHRGTTPSPEALVQSLWSGVLVQYLVQTSLRPEPAGLVTCYGADLQSGTAWLAAARFDDHLHPAAFTAGASQFVDHLFATWPLRNDPQDRTLRLAPSYPALDEVRTAAQGIAICLLLAGVEKLLAERA